MKIKAYVVKFENGTYWKGQGGKITPNLISASFLRKSSIENKSDIEHIKRIVKMKYGLSEPKIMSVEIEECCEYGVDSMINWLEENTTEFRIFECDFGEIGICAKYCGEHFSLTTSDRVKSKEELIKKFYEYLRSL